MRSQWSSVQKLQWLSSRIRLGKEVIAYAKNIAQEHDGSMSVYRQAFDLKYFRLDTVLLQLGRGDLTLAHDVNGRGGPL